MKQTIAKNYDVVIVGAGPSGVTTAGLLGRYGIHTLLIDLEPDVVDIPRAVGICEEGSRIIAAAGMMADIEQDLLDINLLEFADKDQNRVMFADLNKSRNGHRLLRMFSQPALERGLRKSLKKHSSMDFFTETRLTTFTEIDGGVRLSLNQAGRLVETRCQYLLACDGAKSEIRKSLNIGFRGKTYGQDWMILDIEKNPLLNNTVVFNIDPGRPSVTMPGPSGRRRWEFVVKQGEHADDLFAEKNLQTLLKPWGELADMQLVRKAIYTFHARTAEKYQLGRVFLLGDAAHLTPPFAGQGMMAGLRDAYNLAWKLAAVLNKRIDPSTLESYQVERIPQSRQVINTAQRMGTLILPQSRLAAKIRDALIGLLSMVGLHSKKNGLVIDRVANHINCGFLNNKFQQKMRGRGFEFPQHAVSNQQAESNLVDRFLGDHFYILAWQKMPELKARTQADWQAMGGRVANFYTARGDITESPEANLRLIDDEKLYRNFFAGGQRIVVIRPDKMIVISCRPEQLERRLGAYIKSMAFAVQAPLRSKLQEV